MPISGKKMLILFLKKGWKILRKKGSHVIIGRNDNRETIPMHRELKKGTEKALIKKLEGK